MGLAGGRGMELDPLVDDLGEGNFALIFVVGVSDPGGGVGRGG